jgi:hypothetical protein
MNKKGIILITIICVLLFFVLKSFYFLVEYKKSLKYCEETSWLNNSYNTTYYDYERKKIKSIFYLNECHFSGHYYEFYENGMIKMILKYNSVGEIISDSIKFDNSGLLLKIKP